MAELVYDKDGRLLFTQEMKREYTLLMPQMLPVHFGMFQKMLQMEGYKVDMLMTRHHAIVEEGQKYVHNDTCYPALLVIGQLIDAVKNGGYDPHKVALLITQNPESVPKVMWETIEWYKVSFGILGLPLVFALVIIVLIYCVTRFTPSGRAIFAIGGNERTARVAGMSVDRTKLIVFAINGLLAALAGIFLAANLRSSGPTLGDAFTLKIVAACALGGTSLAGGKGSELGTILGVFTVAIIENGMNFIGVDAYSQNVVFGIFVLLAIAITVDRRVRGQIVK